jgi:HSP20 family protein
MKRTNGTAPSFTGLVDKVFREDLGQLFNDSFWGFNGLDRAVNVPVNIRETDKSYELELVAPGLRKEDFRVSLNKDVLTVGFEHREEQQQENKQEQWLRKEYNLRSFTRSFSLEDSLDPNKITAKYADGILHLSLPKRDDAPPLSRTIEIS